MKCPLPLLIVLLLPSFCFGQNKEMQDAIDQKLAAIRFVQAAQDSQSGGFFPRPRDAKVDPADAPPSLRATSAAVRALKYLTGKPVKEAVPNAEKVAAFVMSCYDPKTGGFADAPGGKPDVPLTAVGVMAAIEMEVPKEKFRKAMDYLKENAKTFEEVRIGAAAVEAWGVKDCPFDLEPWFKIATDHLDTIRQLSAKDGGSRENASYAAMVLRLNQMPPSELYTKLITSGQRDDGGWAKKGAKASDMETTYRAMRALYLLKEKPKDVAKLREFIAKCRNTDGGYGTALGEKSTVGGVYFAAIVTKWLDEMEKK